MSAAGLIRFRAARAEDCVQILRGNRTAAFILRERTASGEVTGRWQVWIKHERRWERLASASAIGEALAAAAFSPELRDVSK
jgi:hypothetical protein